MILFVLEPKVCFVQRVAQSQGGSLKYTRFIHKQVDSVFIEWNVSYKKVKKLLILIDKDNDRTEKNETTKQTEGAKTHDFKHWLTKGLTTFTPTKKNYKYLTKRPLRNSIQSLSVYYALRIKFLRIEWEERVTCIPSVVIKTN